ncbi:hypothetical protein QFZ33_000450 [Arthrobacter globiformis]|nr:hypothetical protein [Arthrobacter globiformis]
MYDDGRPDQRKRPGSLWLNFSRAIRGRVIPPVGAANFSGFGAGKIYGRVIWLG